MQRVFVLDQNKKPLMPCTASRARRLLKNGKAVVYRCYPFTILLKQRNGGDIQPIELKIDPGSRTTGIALVLKGKTKNKVIWASNMHHRGHQIKNALEKRRSIRRSRRFRKTRYRPSRFSNRTRSDGWLPPSLISRVQNVFCLARRLLFLTPVSHIHIETVRFDTQKMENPNIEGMLYQQGILAGYEIREYVLQKWKRRCAYCDASGIPLEVDHINPKSKGGSNRVSNLTLACLSCNQRKSNQRIEDFLANDPIRLKRILINSKRSLRDTAAVNATRYAIGNSLRNLSLPISFWSGGRTKYNRTKQNYPKDHWIDAACIGISGAQIEIQESIIPLQIYATGRGNRQYCKMDRFGFPRTKSKSKKRVKGFQTGDLVCAKVTKGKKIGTYVGRVAIRSSGYFNVKMVKETIQGISAQYCQLIHRIDGYMYHTKKEEVFPPRHKCRGIHTEK